MLCEYIEDHNSVKTDRLLMKALWPTSEYGAGRNNTTTFRMAETFFNNTIIVRLRYKSSEVEFTKLDVRTTTTDKIANFGGTFGIWAELTGCSLLGMINLLIISFKLLFRSRNWMEKLKVLWGLFALLKTSSPLYFRIEFVSISIK